MSASRSSTSRPLSSVSTRRRCVFSHCDGSRARPLTDPRPAPSARPPNSLESRPALHSRHTPSHAALDTAVSTDHLHCVSTRCPPRCAASTTIIPLHFRRPSTAQHIDFSLCVHLSLYDEKRMLTHLCLCSRPPPPHPAHSRRSQHLAVRWSPCRSREAQAREGCRCWIGRGRRGGGRRVIDRPPLGLGAGRRGETRTELKNHQRRFRTGSGASGCHCRDGDGCVRRVLLARWDSSPRGHSRLRSAGRPRGLLQRRSGTSTPLEYTDS